MSFRMATIRRHEKPNSYGATQHLMSNDQDVFDSPMDSINTLRNQEESDEEFSCSEFCKKGLRLLYDLTIGACFSSCCRSRRQEKITSPQEDVDIKHMKETLQYHFMNPFEKWFYPRRRQFPWKLLIQLLSIILVTVQLALFANSKFALTDFLDANKRTFTQLFVLDPVAPHYADTVPTPIRVIYTHDDLFEQLNHTAYKYFHLDETALGPYGYQWNVGNVTPAPYLNLKVRKYESGMIDPTTKTCMVSRTLTTDQYMILNSSDPIGDAMRWSNFQRDLPGVVDIHLDFTISSVSITNHVDLNKCYLFNISLLFTNYMDKGNMPVDMDVTTRMSDCNNNNTKSVYIVDSGVLSETWSTVVDGLVIFVSVIAVILCIRSFLYSVYLSKVVRSFFIRKFSWRLKVKHFVPLFNLWFVGILASSALVIVGSIMKLFIAYTNSDSMSLVDATSIILGLAVFCQWCGLLRFLSYFDKYNMLLITLRLAMPSVMRFAVCVGILYISFLLCGWLVLGPYHPKFRDISVTSECLFALLNGDEVFATYAQMSTAPQAVWIFSKIYLYLFVALFIYIVLSVFISLISDTYETLNDKWSYRTRGLLKDFATGQLGRGRAKLDSHHSRSASGDEEDYMFLQDIAGTEKESQSAMESELYVPEPASNIQTVLSDLGPPPADTK